jgi:hypothetical protein
MNHPFKIPKIGYNTSNKEEVMMKKIEGKLVNDSARVNWLLLLIFVLPFLALLPVMIAGEVVFIEGSVILVILGYAISLIFYFTSKNFLVVRLKLEKVNGTLIFTAKGIISKVELKFPFRYNTVLSSVFNRIESQMYLKLSIHDKLCNKSHMYYEKIPQGTKIKGIEIEMQSKPTTWGMIKNSDPYPSVVWRIYQALEKYSGEADARKESVDSPFETK